MAMAIKKMKIIVCIFTFVFFVFNKGNAFAQEDNSIVYSSKDTLKQEKLPRLQVTYDYTDYFYSVWIVELNEPPLNVELDYESYRFTWSWFVRGYHNPLSVRIENHNGNILLIAKYVQSTKYNRRKGIFKNVELFADTVYLEQKEWDNFKDKISSINFFDITPTETTDKIIADGSSWIFEGNNGKLHHMVQRHVSGKTSEIGDICLYLLKLSNIPIKEGWFY